MEILDFSYLRFMAKLKDEATPGRGIVIVSLDREAPGGKTFSFFCRSCSL